MDLALPINKQLGLDWKNITALMPSWRLRRKEIISITVSKDHVKAVLYLEDEQQGIDFAYSYELPDELKEFSWMGDDGLTKKAFAKLNLALEQEGYLEEKLPLLIAVEGYAFTEQLELPVLEKKELEEALAWEIPEHVPWDKESFSYEYEVEAIKDKREGGELTKLQRINIYAMENTCLNSLLKLVEIYDWQLLVITAAEAVYWYRVDSNNWCDIDFYERHYTEEQRMELLSKYATPILVAKIYLQGLLQVNFLPQTTRIKAKLTSMQNMLRTLTCCFSLAVLVCGCGVYGYRYQEQVQLKNIRQKIALMSSWEQRINELHKLQSQEEKLAKEIMLLEKNKILWSVKLKQLGLCMPKGAWLVRVGQQENSSADKSNGVFLRLQGKAQSIEAVAQLVKNLEQSKHYTNVELLTTTEEMGKTESAASYLNFSIVMQLSAGSNKNDKQTRL